MKKSKVSFIFSLIILAGFTSCSQPMNSGYKIHWMDFESAVAASQKQPKKMFIDVYTDWCGWCKKMDASTFMDDSVAAYINANYYPVKFNAESKDTIRFLIRYLFLFRIIKAMNWPSLYSTGKWVIPPMFFWTRNLLP